MSDREAIFASVRRALSAIPEKEKTEYPDWDDSLAVSRNSGTGNDLWERFAGQCRSMGGISFEGLQPVVDYILKSNPDRGCCDPGLVEALRAAGLPESVALQTDFDRTNPDECSFGVTFASGAIAETGTVILKSGDLFSRLAALAPWVHIAIVTKANIFSDIPSAIAALGDDNYISFVTGPSKTADVEGILIQGVHGPGVQICCLIDDADVREKA